MTNVLDQLAANLRTALARQRHQNDGESLRLLAGYAEGRRIDAVLQPHATRPTGSNMSAAVTAPPVTAAIRPITSRLGIIPLRQRR